MRAITGAAHGARALVKGHYRLIDQPADSAVTVGNILAPHRERTLRRMQAHDTVLCIQDGTRLNFTRRGPDAGAGGHRLEPDRRRGPRPGAAHDLGRQSRRGGAGRAAGCLRRARAPQPRGGKRANPEAARGDTRRCTPAGGRLSTAGAWVPAELGAASGEPPVDNTAAGSSGYMATPECRYSGRAKTNRLLPLLGRSSGVSSRKRPVPTLTATYCRPSTA